ncbi:hypothetical protein CK203_036227 [Vitis vinifera]|uniref:Uncharacterized protein n=1 Tax=Vitis vinifera TaxID=29760 RepID=A0A438IWU1_VITVI|nr:hypothetical protein CK203_036227 [Vitis vinifera]
MIPFSHNLLVDSKSLSILKKLETLNLNQNKFRNTTMQQLNTFASLKSLSLQSKLFGRILFLSKNYMLWKTW